MPNPNQASKAAPQANVVTAPVRVAAPPAPPQPPPGTVASVSPGDRVAINNPQGDKGTVMRIGGAGDPPVYKDCYAVHMEYDTPNPDSVEWFCTKTGARLFKLDGNNSARVLPPPPVGAAPANAPKAAKLSAGQRVLYDNQKGTVVRLAAAGDAQVYVANGCYAVHFDYDFNNPDSVEWLCLKTMTSKITVLDGSDKPVGEVKTGR